MTPPHFYVWYLEYFQKKREIIAEKRSAAKAAKRWRNAIMDKRKIITCLTVFVLVVALAGIFYYISCVNRSSTARKGTLVRTFSQKVDECRI